MFKLSLLGSPTLTLEGRSVSSSRKGRALLCYLTLEQPQPRERVATLLWEHSAARQNLRVELTKLRSSGLEFPNQGSCLSVAGLETDFEQWSRFQPGSESELLERIEEVQSLPLEGFSELAGEEFRAWVAQRRHGLTQQLEVRFRNLLDLCLEQGWVRASDSLRSKADFLGLSVATSASPGTFTPEFRPLHFVRPLEEKALLEALECSQRQPLVLLVCGAVGSGKSYLAEWLTQRGSGVSLRISSLRSGRLALASLAAQLMPHVSGPLRELLQTLRSAPQDLETDLVRLTSVLERISPAPLLIFEGTQAAPPELASLFEYWTHNLSAGLLMVLGREEAASSELTRALQRRIGPTHLREVRLQTLSLHSVHQALLEFGTPSERATPQGGDDALLSYANQLLQRSDGNVKHMLTLVEEERRNLQEAGASSGVHEVYLSEAEEWPPELRLALRFLSVVHIPFDEHLSTTLLERMGLSHPNRLLASGLERGVLHPLPSQRVLVFPDWTPLEDRPRPVERFEFEREAMRIALASTLTQPSRQELRRHLSDLLERDYPGMASYYAARAGQPERATGLLERHFEMLEPGSPLRLGAPTPRLGPSGDAGAASSSLGTSSLAAPLHTAVLPLRELGYAVSLERGQLCIRRRGRYGHAETLRLLFPLPESAGPASSNEPAYLRLVWRLDTFNGGYDLFPTQVPFALRLRRYGHARAEVLSPEHLTDFGENGTEHYPRDDLSHGWMEHYLPLEGPQSSSLLELSVRALDVALMVDTLEFAGQDLLRSRLERRKQGGVRDLRLRLFGGR